MNLSLITNDPLLSTEADELVDRIMIDLEYIGKKDRQTGKDLFHSTHELKDIPTVKSVLKNSSLVVRVNSIHDQSLEEINNVIAGGADVIMLPFFKSLNEVVYFIECVDKRAKVSLLIETKESVSLLEKLINIPDVCEFHIGLNDLSISLGNNTIFETILDGTIKHCIDIMKQSNKPYGFGGVGSISNRSLVVDPLLLLSEQIRLGCSIGWLGRSFRDLIKNKENLEYEVILLKEAINNLKALSSIELENNHVKLCEMIKQQKSQLQINLKPYRI